MTTSEIVHEATAILGADILRFEDDGAWAITIRLGERTQGLWLSCAPDGTPWLHAESRSGPLGDADPRELLHLAAEHRFCSVVLLDHDEVAVRVTVPCDVPAKPLAEALGELGQFADALEERLLGIDRH